MKQPIDLNTALANTRQKTEQLRSIGVKPPVRPARVKPRTAGETMALCRAVWQAVDEAKKSGRLTKLSPVGYRLRWED